MSILFKVFKKISIVIVIVIFIADISVPFSSAEAEAYSVSATAAIFSNSTKVVRYYGKNVHTKVPPASTTKVMTALLVLEKLPLNKIVTASERAASAQPTKIHVSPGEKFRVSDLLHAILVKSANDASIVLAEAAAGSEWEFVKMMNKRARQLGCKNTKFMNSNGLPTKESQYTTPYDMYLIFREAIKHPFFKAAIKNKHKTITSQSGRTIKLTSHNKMLFFDWKNRIYGKTGWTRSAKACFVGYVQKGDDICIIAVFGCTRRWDDIKHIVSHYGGISL